jgi:hypothetical protein
MYGDKLVYKNIRTGEIVKGRRIPVPPHLMEPDIVGPLEPFEWIPGVIGADKIFHRADLAGDAGRRDD